MIYTVYESSFKLPGACADQITFEKWATKKEFLKNLIDLIEENSSVIENMEEDRDEDISDLKKKLESLRDDENVESLSINGFIDEIGCYFLKIYVADPYPELKKRFFKELEDTVLEYFEEYEDLEKDEYEDYEGEELFDLYLLWNKVKRQRKIDEDSFEELFDRLSEFFYDQSVF